MYECIPTYETNYVRILMLKTLLSDYQTSDLGYLINVIAF